MLVERQEQEQQEQQEQEQEQEQEEQRGEAVLGLMRSRLAPQLRARVLAFLPQAADAAPATGTALAALAGHSALELYYARRLLERAPLHAGRHRPICPPGRLLGLSPPRCTPERRLWKRAVVWSQQPASGRPQVEDSLLLLSPGVAPPH